MPLKSQCYIIVGGAGLVGSALARVLSSQGQSVIICDHFGHLNDQKWAHMPSNLADIWTPDALIHNLEKTWQSIAGVILLADGGHQDGDIDALFETSYHLPRRVWDFCAAKQRPIYWASSTQVYGQAASNLSTDPAVIAAFKPFTAFGRVKQAFDVFAARQGTGSQAPPIATGFRLVSVYGAHEDHKAELASLPNLLLSAERYDRQVTLNTKSAEYVRHWLHVDDAAGAMAALILERRRGYFDIGTGPTITTEDLLASASKVAQQNIGNRCNWDGGHLANAHIAANLSPLDMLHASIQFRTLEQGLSDIWQMM